MKVERGMMRAKSLLSRWVRVPFFAFALCVWIGSVAFAASPLQFKLDLNASPRPSLSLNADYQLRHDQLIYAVQLANVLDSEEGLGASGLMLAGKWRPIEHLFGQLELGASTYIHKSEHEYASNLLLHGTAFLGSALSANVNIGHIERPIDERLFQPHAEWNALGSRGPLTYFDASLRLLTSTSQFWQHNVQAYQYRGGEGAVALATGGWLHTNSGWFSLQAGILFGDSQTRPLARMSYIFQNESNGRFELAYETASIFRPSSAVELGYTFEGGWYQWETKVQW